MIILPSMKNLNKKNTDKNTLQNVLNDLFDGFKWLKNDRLNIALSLQAMVGNFGASAILGYTYVLFIVDIKSYLRTKWL